MTNITTRVLVAAAVLVAACRAKDQAAFTKRADQIDRAHWENVCGPVQDEERIDFESRADVIVTTFNRFELVARPHLPPTFVCMVARYEKDATIKRLTFRVGATDEWELREAYGPVRDLTRDLVPEHLWPFVTVVAESAGRIELHAYGFRIKGGFWRLGDRWLEWELEVRNTSF